MIPEEMDQLERAEGIKPGMHLPGELFRVTALPESVFKRLAGPGFLQPAQ